MSDPSVEELERAFAEHVGVPRIEFYRFLEEDARRLLRVVDGEGSLTREQRAMASRSLAYLVQGKDAVPDAELLGHVDDYIILLVVRDELFPEEPSELRAEVLLRKLTSAQQERVSRSIDTVMRSKESFPAAVLRGALDRVFAELRRRRSEPRDVITLMTTVLPGVLKDMACAVVKDAFDPDVDRD